RTAARTRRWGLARGGWLGPWDFSPAPPADYFEPPRRQALPAGLFLREQLVELLLVGVVAEEVVQLLARLQAVDDVLLRAFAAHGLVEAERSLVHRAVGAAAVQRDVDVRISQLVGGEERRGAELGEVGQDRHLHRGLEAAVVVERLHRLGEDHV